MTAMTDGQIEEAPELFTVVTDSNNTGPNINVGICVTPELRKLINKCNITDPGSVQL